MSEVPEVLTLLKGTERFTVPRERKKSGRPEVWAQTPVPRASVLPLFSRQPSSLPNPGTGSREKRCCLEFKMLHKYMRLSAEPRELRSQWRD